MAVMVTRNWIFRPEVPTTSGATAAPALDMVVQGPSTYFDVDTDRMCEPLREWSPMAIENAAGNPCEFPPSRSRRRKGK